MHIDAPTNLEAWIDSHHAELAKAIPALKAIAGSDAAQIDLLKKFTSDEAFRTQYETELTTSLKNLKAPDSIQRELAAYSAALHNEWDQFAAPDKAAVTKLIGGLSTKTTKQDIVKHVADIVERSAVSPRVASNMVHGMGPLMSAIPWWCFVCYSVPIWGLICIAVKRCRGEVSTTTTKAVP